MKNSINTKGIILVVAMILVASFSRIIPHFPNFTAVGAMALFGSAYFSRKHLAIIAPLAALWLSDLVINNTIYAEYNEGFVWFQSYQLYTFLPILLITIFGIVLFKKVNLQRIFAGSITSSIVFFLISNFGTWASPFALFPKTMAGLIETYIFGLPFLRNDLIGTLFFSAVMFGSYHFITKMYPGLSLRKTNAALLA